MFMKSENAFFPRPHPAPPLSLMGMDETEQFISTEECRIFFLLGVREIWINYLQSLIISSETRAQTLNFRVTIDLDLASAWFLTDLHFTGQAFANPQII